MELRIIAPKEHKEQIKNICDFFGAEVKIYKSKYSSDDLRFYFKLNNETAQKVLNQINNFIVAK